MEKNEETNPWSHPSPEIEDILFKEVFRRLNWDDIRSMSICKVNKAWKALFKNNNLWKSVLQNELPFVDLSNTTDYYKKFCDTVASFNTIKCPHTEADVNTATRVCPCLLPLDLSSAREHLLYYTGNKHEFIIKSALCNCHEKIPTREYWQYPLICKDCHEDLKNNVDFIQPRGSPEAKHKWGGGMWIHKELELSEEILAAKPIPNSTNIIAITKSEPVKKLVLLKINGDKIEQEVLDDCLGDTLQISSDGKFVAAYHEKGTLGFVYNLETKARSFDFHRGPYQVINSAFPVAFFKHENKEYLIAGKEWNRVDLYDPATGESLRERDVTNRHLEFFWCKLHVSPDQKNVCSFGWVWHPIGTCLNFSIEDWMQGKEDSLYAMEKYQRITEGYDWDYPMCWLDDNTIAIWGDSGGSMDHHGLPVVRSVTINPNNETKTNTNSNTVTKEPLWVPLGESPLVFDEYLISLNPNGIEVVDVNDSHVLEFSNQREMSQVLCYNKETKQVISTKKHNAKVLVLSHIQYYDK